jgi:TorA maturation chaperone TorD
MNNLSIGLEKILEINNKLAQALHYPDEGLTQALLSGSFVGELYDALELVGLEHLRREVEEIQHFISLFNSDEALRLELQKDYTRMFFASRPRLVHLFESAYKEGKLYQNSTFCVARLYHGFGFEFHTEFNLPPDHVAVEMDFVGYLISWEVKNLRDGNLNEAGRFAETIHNMLEEHLGSFVDQFADRLEKSCKTQFYKSVAKILEGYMSFLIGKEPYLRQMQP